MSHSVGVHDLSRRVRHFVAAAEEGGAPMLVTRRHHWVALLVSLEDGLAATAEAGAPTEVGITSLAAKLSRVLRMVERERRVVVITRSRRSVAMLVPAEGPLMDDYVRGSQRRLDEFLHQLKEQSPDQLLARLEN